MRTGLTRYDEEFRTPASSEDDSCLYSELDLLRTRYYSSLENIPLDESSKFDEKWSLIDNLIKNRGISVQKGQRIIRGSFSRQPCETSTTVAAIASTQNYVSDCPKKCLKRIGIVSRQMCNIRGITVAERSTR